MTDESVATFVTNANILPFLPLTKNVFLSERQWAKHKEILCLIPVLLLTVGIVPDEFIQTLSWPKRKKQTATVYKRPLLGNLQ